MRPVPACAAPFVGQVEGDSKASYQDSGGVWTIGRGHTGLAVGPGMTIDQATDDGYLASDLLRFAGVVCDEVADDHAVAALSDDQYGALISFAFNLGTLGSTIPGLVRKGKLSAVPSVMMRYDHAHIKGKLVELPGLKRRRSAEVVLWNTGDVQTAVTVATSAPQIGSSVVRALDTPPAPEPSAKPLVQSKTIWGGLGIAAGGLVEVANQIKDTAAPLISDSALVAKAAEGASVLLFVGGLAVVLFRYLDEREKRT